MMPAITSRAATDELTVSMTPPVAGRRWPPLAYVSLIRSSVTRPAGSVAGSFGAGPLQQGVSSFEDPLVDDEDEGEHEHREDRRDAHIDQPVPAFFLASRDPAFYRRQPEGEQEETAGGVLVEALMEDGIAISGETRAI